VDEYILQFKAKASQTNLGDTALIEYLKARLNPALFKSTCLLTTSDAGHFKGVVWVGPEIRLAVQAGATISDYLILSSFGYVDTFIILSRTHGMMS